VNNHLRALALVGSGLLASCGGGGGGSSFTPPAGDLAITSANAMEVTSAVIVSASLLSAVGETSGGELGPDAAAASTGLQAYAADSVVAKTQAQAQSGVIAAAQTFGPETEPCTVAGTVSLSGDLANPPDLTAGDRITAVFTNCDDGDGIVLDGRLDLVIRSLQGDPLSGIFRLEADLTLDNLAMTEDSVTHTADGEFTLTLDTLSAPINVTRLVGDFLDLGGDGDDFTLTDFDQEIEDNLGTVPSTHEQIASGTLFSDTLGGTVHYLTEQGQPLLSSGADAPYSGIIRITGAGNSQVRAVVVGSGLVELEVDADGDGTAESVIDTTWSELAGE
jgi:hypothetical protein